MKRAYVVTGPESAGNRILTALLISAGCHGEASVTAPDTLPQAESPAVVLRSLPHAGHWPDVRAVCNGLMQRGYRVTVLVTAREPVALLRSQVMRGHQPDTQAALHSVRRAYQHVIPQVQNLDWYMVPLEGLVLSEAAQEALLGSLGLPAPTGPLVWEDALAEGFVDVNRKHYGSAA